MDLSEARLSQVLGVRPFQFFPQIGSTNDQALAWLSAGAPPGAVVLADEQTKGRGRLGRSWFAPPGTALMFSYLLCPSPQQLTYVGMVGALAVCEATERLGLSPGIKWPNDVWLDGRKLSGVLPEAAWHGENLVGVSLGIGVNIRIDFAATPFAETAVSLETVVGALDRADFLASILVRLDFWASRLSSDQLFEAWRSRLIVLGQQVSISGLSGIAESVDRHGALLVRDSSGTLQRVLAGDIALGQVREN